MSYSIGKLAKLAGVSVRTLDYYDEIGLLHPSERNASGYRMYGNEEVDILQQIMFYRELGFSLDDIKRIINSVDFSRENALKEHYKKLLRRRDEIDELLRNVQDTIRSMKGEMDMRDDDKFKGLKKQIIKENERKYGKELRERFGSEKIDESNKRFEAHTKEEHDRANELSSAINRLLKEAYSKGDPGSEKAQELAGLHKEWLMLYWDEYSPEAHLGLAETYVSDDRFRKYYDDICSGCAGFLKEAISIFVKTGN